MAAEPVPTVSKLPFFTVASCANANAEPSTNAAAATPDKRDFLIIILSPLQVYLQA